MTDKFSRIVRMSDLMRAIVETEHDSPRIIRYLAGNVTLNELVPSLDPRDFISQGEEFSLRDFLTSELSHALAEHTSPQPDLAKLSRFQRFLLKLYYAVNKI